MRLKLGMVGGGKGAFIGGVHRIAARPDGIDAVAIVTPNHLHASVATVFLRVGIPVICDKPHTTAVEDAEALNLLGDVTGIKIPGDGEWQARKHGVQGRRHNAIIDRQATAIIPIRKNGRPGKEDCQAAIARNETLRATRHYGRAFWKRWTGYHARSRIKAQMRCLKAFG